jgi:hypothetical protein
VSKKAVVVGCNDFDFWGVEYLATVSLVDQGFRYAVDVEDCLVVSTEPVSESAQTALKQCEDWDSVLAEDGFEVESLKHLVPEEYLSRYYRK